MTLPYSSVKYKVQRLGRPRKDNTQQTTQDAWLLLDIIARNNPTPKELRVYFGLGETRYRAAFKNIKGQIWLVSGRYELRKVTQ